MAVRRGAVVLIWAFALQFVIGMVLNLFVTLPDKHPGANGAEYFATSLTSLGWALSFGGGWALFTHAAIALDFSSMIMAGCWLIAVGSLVAAVVRNPRPRTA